MVDSGQLKDTSDEIMLFLYVYKTRQAMNLWRNFYVRLCNQCCSGKAVSITKHECAFLALGIQHAMRMRQIVNCGLSAFTMLLNIFSQWTWFSIKKIIEHKMSV